jgi:hypothetical protein
VIQPDTLARRHHHVQLLGRLVAFDHRCGTRFDHAEQADRALRDPLGLSHLARQALLVHPGARQITHLDAEFPGALLGTVPDQARQFRNPTGEIFEQDVRVTHKCPQTARGRQPTQRPPKPNPVQSFDCPHDLVLVQFHQLHSSILSLVPESPRGCYYTFSSRVPEPAWRKVPIESEEGRGPARRMPSRASEPRNEPPASTAWRPACRPRVRRALPSGVSRVIAPSKALGGDDGASKDTADRERKDAGPSASFLTRLVAAERSEAAPCSPW